MKHFLKTLITMFVLAAPLAADFPRTHEDTKGLLSFQWNPTVCDPCYAFSLLGEVGEDNFRANGTLGYALNECNLFKVGAEYLGQRHKFHFSTGSDKHFVNQVAVGIGHKMYFGQYRIESFELYGNYSHAFDRNLTNFMTSTETTTRSLSDSNAYEAEFVTTFDTFCYGKLRGKLIYDYVSYGRKYQNDVVSNGFGGGFELNQPLGGNFYIDLGADWKRPYNYYHSKLRWNLQRCYHYNIFANYTEGRRGLNDDFKVGVGITFELGRIGRSLCKTTDDCCTPCCPNPCLQQWVSRPAVYRPVTLVIADEQTTITCVPPEATGTPGTQSDNTGNSVNLDVSGFFTGTDLTFSATGLPDGLSIDPTTGVISGTLTNNGNFNVTVTATNDCGSADISFVWNVSFPD